MPRKFKLLDISDEKRDIIVRRLVHESSPRQVFMALVFISTIIASIGLLNDSASLVIGGMLAAPLLSPVLSIALGIVTADTKLIGFASFTILGSAAVVVITSVIVSLFHIPIELTQEILERTEILFMLPVAIVAGAAAVLALAHRDAIAVIPGIVVSVALLPPISVVGIGIASFNWYLVQSAFGLFLVNLIGIIFVSTILFSLMGFSVEHVETARALKAERHALKKEQEALKKSSV